MLIEMARGYLDPASIFQVEVGPFHCLKLIKVKGDF